MRISIKFVTIFKLDHEYYHFNLDDIFSDEYGEVKFYYSAYYWNQVPKNIQDFFNSNLCIEMQKDIEIQRPESDIEKKVKLQVIQSLSLSKESKL